SSTPNRTASNSRSNEKITRPAVPRRAALFRFARLVEGRDHFARLVGVRIDDDLLAVLPELLHVLVGDAAELRLDDARLRPLPVLAELDRADDGAHLVLLQVGRDLRILEAVRAVHRLLEHLADGVIERRQVEAQRID